MQSSQRFRTSTEVTGLPQRSTFLSLSLGSLTPSNDSQKAPLNFHFDHHGPSSFLSNTIIWWAKCLFAISWAKLQQHKPRTAPRPPPMKLCRHTSMILQWVLGGIFQQTKGSCLWSRPCARMLQAWKLGAQIARISPNHGGASSKGEKARLAACKNGSGEPHKRSKVAPPSVPPPEALYDPNRCSMRLRSQITFARFVIWTSLQQCR